MTKIKKGPDMQTAIDTVTKPTLKVPEKIRKPRLMQAEVNPELFDMANEEMKKMGITIKTMAEYGLKAFLLRVNPGKFKKYLDKEIGRLGLKVED